MKNTTLFINACSKNLTESVKLMMKDPSVDVSYDNNVAFKNACANGCLETVKLLLNDNRINPTIDSNEAFRLACRNNRKRVVSYLLNDERIDPNDYNGWALEKSLENNNIAILDILLNSKKINIAINNFNWAIKETEGKIWRFLLKNKKHRTTIKNSNLLKIEAIKGNIKLLKTFYRSGLRISKYDYLEIKETLNINTKKFITYAFTKNFYE